jgi:N-acyl-D-glutamate deacylase
MLLKAPLLIHHDNDYGWWEVEEKLKIARDDGHNVWGEYFPYKSGSTVIGADFLRPEIWEEAYGNKYEETMYDPLSGEFIDRATYDQLVAEDPAHTIILFFPWREPWLMHWLTIPEMTLGSDSMGGDGVDGQHLPWDADYTEFAGHPRTAGNYAKTLRLGRENGVPLMFTLAQTSYWSAKHLGDAGIEAMRQRGRLQEGKIADITVFDPLSVTDNSTYEVGENGLPSTGIPYVIVNGTVVVQDSEVLPVKPGQPIRYAIEPESRWQPLNVDEWLGEYTINIPTLPDVDDAGLDEVL